MEEKVSILIPAYNAEKTIKKCLDSVISQTFSNIEILLVEDCSEDNTLTICQQYAQKDDRVKLIQGEHKGISAARNQGLEQATGRWLMCVDADDYLAADYVMQMYHRKKQCDAELVISNYYNVDEEERKAYDLKVNKQITREQYIEQLIQDPSHYYFGVVWNKLYDLNMIKEHKLCFPEKVSLGEDFIFNMDYLYLCKNIGILDFAGYYYVQKNITSESRKDIALIDRLTQRNSMFASYKIFFWRLGVYEKYRKDVEYYMLRHAALELACILFPFSFKGWCIIRKKCLEENQLDSFKNTIWITVAAVKLRMFPGWKIRKQNR